MLGKGAGGFLTKLKQAVGLTDAIRALELASGKENPGEYIGKIVAKGRLLHDDDPADVWRAWELDHSQADHGWLIAAYLHLRWGQAWSNTAGAKPGERAAPQQLMNALNALLLLEEQTGKLAHEVSGRTPRNMPKAQARS